MGAFFINCILNCCFFNPFIEQRTAALIRLFPVRKFEFLNRLVEHPLSFLGYHPNLEYIANHGQNEPANIWTIHAISA